MYWRCSANSVEKPVYGERCNPEMNPSTTVRASSSSEVIRARTSGARNLGAPEYACVDCPFDGSLVSVFFSLSQFIFVSESFVSDTAPGGRLATGSRSEGRYRT